MTTLDQLRPGQEGEVMRIQGSDALACRLREMGFVPGECVRFVSAAPLGDPLHCIIQGSRIALRRTEAQRVCLLAPQRAASSAGSVHAGDAASLRGTVHGGAALPAGSA